MKVNIVSNTERFEEQVGISESATTNPSPSKSLTVDRAAGIVRGLKVLGFNSRKQDGTIKRVYTEQAVERAVKAGMFEGVVVNYSPHSQDAMRVGTKDSRPATETLGKLVNTKFVAGSGGGVVGDLLYLKSVAFSETFCEACERMPDVWGLSAMLDGTFKMEGEVQYVTKIEFVKCVDLVRNPATTQSLVESQDEGEMSVCESCSKARAILEDSDSDDSGKLTKLKEVYPMAESNPLSPAKDSMNVPAPKDAMKASMEESTQKQPAPAAPAVDAFAEAAAEIKAAKRQSKIQAFAESVDVQLDPESLGDLAKLDDASAIRLIKKMALAESQGVRTPVPAAAVEAKAQAQQPEPKQVDAASLLTRFRS